MARNKNNTLTKEFTKNIHSTNRKNTEFANMENWNEKYAKNMDKICCHDCRFFSGSCSNFIGKYHKPCKDFKWW